MAVQGQPHMSQNGIGSSLCHLVYGGGKVGDAGYGSHGYAMIHGYNDRSVRPAIQNAFQPDRLSYFAHGCSLVSMQIKDNG
jgi:hypothetical protein